jgi:Integrase core domain
MLHDEITASSLVKIDVDGNKVEPSDDEVNSGGFAFHRHLKGHGIMISMDGKGRCMDNIFAERLWRNLKYEEVYLHAYASVAEAKAGIGAWLEFYNTERQHQSLGYRTPRQIYQEGLWICGRSALPTGYASPASRASSVGGEMLAFAHIPTGAAANKNLILMKSKVESLHQPLHRQ